MGNCERVRRGLELVVASITASRKKFGVLEGGEKMRVLGKVICWEGTRHGGVLTDDDEGPY